MSQKKVSMKDVAFVIILLGLIVVIGFLVIENATLKARLFSLTPGEMLPQLKFVSSENTPLEFSKLSTGVSIIFCFKTPCSPCNENLTLWKKLSQYFADKVFVMGIIPDGDTSAFQLLENRKLNFPIFIPTDKVDFAMKMRLKTNTAQTLIVYNNQLKAIRFGTLSADELNLLIKIIKKLIAT